MKQLFLLLTFLLVSVLSFAQTNPNHVKVNGYYRKNGTYVKPHYRTAPNSTNRDNFSTFGNINPYTGQAGSITPDNNSLNTGGTPQSTYYPSSNNSSSSGTYYTPSNSTITNNNNDYEAAAYQGSINSLGQRVITYSNGKEIFGLCSSCYKINYDKNLDYYWYSPTEGVQDSKGFSEGKLLNGEYKFYDEKGNLTTKGNYRNGLKHGNFIINDKYGNIEEKSHFTNGIIDYIKFANDSGYIIEWNGGILSSGSIKKVYTSDNTLIEQATVDEDFIFHYELYYERTGAIESKFSQDLFGKYQGNYVSYYPNGQVEFEAQFKAGLRFGIWKWSDENGGISNRKTYNIHEEQYSNGNIKIKGSQYYDFENYIWIKDGIWIEYESNGEIQKNITYYKDGQISESKD
jgi:antitoxin component YwqK of YwqJK toxin-antitoxin module